MRQPVDKNFFTFNRGLITEASPTNFPEEASFEEENFELLNKGYRRRRRALRQEVDPKTFTPPVGIEPGDAFNTFTWRNAGGDPNKIYIVIQMGYELYLFENKESLGKATPDYTYNLLALKPYETSAEVTEDTIRKRDVSFTAGRGMLYITHPLLDVGRIRTHPDTENFPDEWLFEPIPLRVRDFAGIDDRIPVTSTPASPLSDEHRYNLVNRGWNPDPDATAPRGIENYWTNSAGTSADRRYPAKSMVPWYGDVVRDPAGTSSNQSYQGSKWKDLGDVIRDWNPDKMLAEIFGEASAPQGAIIMSPFSSARYIDDNTGGITVSNWGTVNTVLADQTGAYVPPAWNGDDSNPAYGSEIFGWVDVPAATTATIGDDITVYGTEIWLFVDNGPNNTFRLLMNGTFRVVDDQPHVSSPVYGTPTVAGPFNPGEKRLYFEFPANSSWPGNAQTGTGGNVFYGLIGFGANNTGTFIGDGYWDAQNVYGGGVNAGYNKGSKPGFIKGNLFSANLEDNIEFPERPSTTEFYAGRIFYGGINDERWGDVLFFSQLLRTGSEAGDCFQNNDPTDPELNFLTPEDGGTIQIPEIGKIVALEQFRDVLLCFGTNGVWAISGQQGGFTALSYTVQKIADVPAYAPKSIVATDNAVLYASPRGVYGISFNEYGTLVNTSLTEDTIQTYWDELDESKRSNCQFVYSSVEQRLHILHDKDKYDSTINTGYSRDLIFDSRLGAFSLYTFPTTNTTSLLGAVKMDYFEGINEYNNIKYLAKVDNNSRIWFLDYTDTSSWEDWNNLENVPFLVTGYDNIKDFSRQRYAPIIHTFMEENGSDSSLYMQAMWDFTTSEDTNKWSNPQQIYRPYNVRSSVYDSTFSTERSTIVTRNKVRGRGRVLQLRFEGELGKDAVLYGWQITYKGNRRI